MFGLVQWRGRSWKGTVGSHRWEDRREPVFPEKGGPWSTGEIGVVDGVGHRVGSIWFNGHWGFERGKVEDMFVREKSRRSGLWRSRSQGGKVSGFDQGRLRVHPDPRKEVIRGPGHGGRTVSRLGVYRRPLPTGLSTPHDRGQSPPPPSSRRQR